jgi:hypothetical protein
MRWCRSNSIRVTSYSGQHAQPIVSSPMAENGSVSPILIATIFPVNYRMESTCQIQRLHEDGKFTLILPHSVKSEIGHPHTPASVYGLKRICGFRH